MGSTGCVTPGAHLLQQRQRRRRGPLEDAGLGALLQPDLTHVQPRFSPSASSRALSRLCIAVVTEASCPRLGSGRATVMAAGEFVCRLPACPVPRACLSACLSARLPALPYVPACLPAYPDTALRACLPALSSASVCLPALPPVPACPYYLHGRGILDVLGHQLAGLALTEGLVPTTGLDTCNG